MSSEIKNTISENTTALHPVNSCWFVAKTEGHVLVCVILPTVHLPSNIWKQHETT